MKNLIIQVPNSIHWDNKEKEEFRDMLIKHFKDEYRLLISFNSNCNNNKLIFQVLEYPKLINFFKSILFRFKIK